MTVTVCGSVSMLTLGMPGTTAVPDRKGTLPKAAFVVRAPLGAGLKARFVNDVAAIRLLGILRPDNTGAADGARVHEALVLGLRLTKPDAPVPVDVVERIAAQRRDGMVFVCVRDGHAMGADADADGGRTPTQTQAQTQANAGPDDTVEQVAFAVRRKLPGRAGHVARYAVYAGDWRDAADARLAIDGATMDEIWESLCSQAILGTVDHADLDERIARRDAIAGLRAEEARLTRDHARAKSADRRNEAFAKLHKVRVQLAELARPAGAGDAGTRS